MNLFDAIMEANGRALAGDASAGLRPAEFADSLPVAALTCIDPRLNPLIPNVLGIPEDQFIWLRNAGNIVTSPTSSTMRSLALACAVKNAEEIVVIGHTDCLVCKTSTMQLLERFKNLGIERHLLPDNVTEYFGMFSSERQNVIKACDIIRQSPLIGPKIPVHGLLLNIETGQLERLVNGYEKWNTMSDKLQDFAKSAGESVDKLKSLTDFQIGEMKFPETKIGEVVTKAEDWLAKKVESVQTQLAQQAPAIDSASSSAANIAGEIVEMAEKHWPKAAEKLRRPPAPPPKISAPPPIRVRPLPPRNKR